MKTGFSKICINPSYGSPIVGYYEPRFTKGILDNLYVRAVAFNDGENKAIIISLDLIELGQKYFDALKDTVNQALGKLQTLCPRPIITGITDENSISVHFSLCKGHLASYAHQNVAGFFCGAGDVFTSAFVGCLARGKSADRAIELASDFVAAVIQRSSKEVPDKKYGLNFEAEIFPFLQELND